MTMVRISTNKRWLISSLLPGLLLSACLSTGGGTEGVAMPQKGFDQFDLVEGQVQSSAGCQFDYRVFRPLMLESMTNHPLIIIGHGFLRHQDTMSSLAKGLANQGLRVATLEFCNMRPWNGHHRRNGDDMRLLAEHLQARTVIYAGFSAGALAALLAAAADANTVGVVTLDLVDQAGLAVSAAETLDVPVLGIAGRASSCNRMGAAVKLFENDGRKNLTTIDDASHCEFESPTDGWCETACGDNESDTANESQRSAIIDEVMTRIDALVSGVHNVAASRSANRSFVVAPQRQQ